jgi:hypothetical protein
MGVPIEKEIMCGARYMISTFWVVGFGSTFPRAHEGVVHALDKTLEIGTIQNTVSLWHPLQPLNMMFSKCYNITLLN